jgi:alpha-beta hydrolase superfamily lysophospholipase
LNHEEGTLATDDGLSLYWQAWTPPGECDGVLLLVHGLGEHSGRYLNPVRHFVARGWACYGFDYRGHGRSPGPRVHVGSIDEYLDDVAEGHRLVRLRHPGKPTFLVGHSQGGLLALLFAMRGSEHLTGIVVSSPFLAVHPDSKPSPVVMGASKILARLAPKKMFASTVDSALLSRDREVSKQYDADPLVSRRVSVGWALAIADAQRAVVDGAPTLATPTLVMQAGSDRLVDPEATREWVALAPGDQVQYVEWKGYYHELFNEPIVERRQVFDRMEAWLDEHVG